MPASGHRSTCPYGSFHMRLFIAIEIDPAIVEKLEAIRARLRKADADVKWVEPENSHLTLKFIGEMDAGRLHEIKAVIARAAATVQPFELAIRTAGCFPEARPRVLWIGAEDASGTMQRLHAGIDAGLAPLGVEQDSRAFTAHLTLGRIRSPKNVRKLLDLLNAENPADLGRSRVESVTLFESKLSPRGPTYMPVAHAKLGT